MKEQCDYCGKYLRLTEVDHGLWACAGCLEEEE